MLYTIVSKGTLRVTHKDVLLADLNLTGENDYFIPTEECGVHKLGDLYNEKGHSFGAYIVSLGELQEEHAALFKRADKVLLRHFEGTPELSAVELADLKAYRVALRSHYHTLVAIEDPQWPTLPSFLQIT